MASVQVFVDDAVLGHLPGVCAKTGLPSEGVQRVERTSGTIGVAAVLLLFGPIGWVVFAVVALSRTSERLTVRLPMTRAAAESEQALERFRMWFLGGSVLCVVCAALRLPPLRTRDWFAVALLAALIGIAFHLMLAFRRVDVELDASRRWVTLRGVHPNFAAAVHHDASFDRRIEGSNDASGVTGWRGPG